MTSHQGENSLAWSRIGAIDMKKKEGPGKSRGRQKSPGLRRVNILTQQEKQRGSCELSKLF